QAEGCVVVHSIDQALEVAAGSDEVMVIGGEKLYQQVLDRADRLYLTLVKSDVEGDTWFPEFDLTQWREVQREAHSRDDKNEFDYEFVLLERV
ncbi:Dihydrofolate reductase, partial [hydrothermal vent metagenome]